MTYHQHRHHHNRNYNKNHNNNSFSEYKNRQVTEEQSRWGGITVKSLYRVAVRLGGEQPEGVND
uniref:Uncharacterized protein n=1 Tax=Anguilla anguilla TaxID=7936 RepID=A0A0E9RIJ7_ANGAN